MSSQTPSDGDRKPVPQLTDSLPWHMNAELFVLRRILGPLRRRRRRDPLPPPLSGEETARRLFELPVSYWSYDFEPGVRHLGPMSQDFADAFGLSRYRRKIHMVDANGVAVVAIQSLHRRVSQLEAEVERLSSALAATGSDLDDLSAARQTYHRGAPTMSTATGNEAGADEQGERHE